MQRGKYRHLGCTPHLRGQGVLQLGRHGVLLRGQRILHGNYGDPQRRIYLGRVLRRVQLEAHGVCH